MLSAALRRARELYRPSAVAQGRVAEVVQRLSWQWTLVLPQLRGHRSGCDLSRRANSDDGATCPLC